MAYSYTAGTNKISSITDAASATQGGFPAASGSYTYDTNGNQISDGAKGFTAITYNHLNLPTKFTQGANTIEIQYDAAGRKLKKIPSGGATKSYIGAFEYSTSTVEAVYHSEGRARNSAGTYIYEYLIKDHLGNTRVAFTNTTGTIALVQENHYYAFGKSQAGWLAEPSPTNAYKYNGKELNTEFGLNLMDYGARWYDAGVGRWTSVDPMADHPNQIDKSPYIYAWNNPVILNDPDGRCPDCPNPPQPSALGIIVEIFNHARAAVFNFGERFREAQGLGTPGFETRMSVNYSEDGSFTLENKIETRPAAGFIQNSKEVFGDALALIPINATKGMSGPMLAARAPVKNTIISFIKKTNEGPKMVDTHLPEGFKRVKDVDYSHGQKVYSDGKRWIS